jgi:hypothetical protein
MSCNKTTMALIYIRQSYGACLAVGVRGLVSGDAAVVLHHVLALGQQALVVVLVAAEIHICGKR